MKDDTWNLLVVALTKLFEENIGQAKKAKPEYTREQVLKLACGYTSGDILSCLWRIHDEAVARLGPDKPATVDMGKLEALHAEMQQGLREDGGKWPVFTGDGD